MKSKVNRRQFLSTVGAGVVGSQVIPLLDFSTAEYHPEIIQKGDAQKMWIDPRFAKFPSGSWRKIHLDFHNSKHILKVGDRFNADQWADQLVEGNVDSIVVFAKDMHGYSYYPSKIGPVHPGLSFDLLGEQVKACHKRDIAVYAYYCSAWDNYLAETHPEWSMIRRDGSDYRPKADQTPGWTALCLGNIKFVDHIADQVKEFVSKYELNGAWLDMAEPITSECYCKECLRLIEADGKDPYNKEIQRNHQNKNFLDFHHRMKELVHSVRPESKVDFNDIGIGKVSERAELLDNIDIEALPTGGWGYFYAPAQVRYQRNFGIPVYGMTGRFVSSWADFGGLKLPQQLDVELASLVANVARCDVGDQMPPEGVLDPAVYYVIGKSFGRIRKLEPWLNQSAPVTEAALMIPAIPLEKLNQTYIFGIVKLMIELHLQFDLVEPGHEWERYNLLVIPDELMQDKITVERIHKYIAGGGAVIVSHYGGLNSENKQSWLERYGFTFKGDSTFKPAYIVTEKGFTGEMPGYAYALYNGASQWLVEAPAKSIAQLGEPLFQRSPEHYTSHNQSPYDHVTGFSSLAVSGRIGLVGFPIGNSYYEKGYWIYRSIFERLTNEVLPKRLIETNAPLSTELTVTYQPSAKQIKRPERYLVHIINWSLSRKTTPHPEFHEDPVALTDLRIKLNIPLKNVKASAVVMDIALKHIVSETGIVVTIPRVGVSEIVCFEMQ
jgi:hypothetical protein